MATVKLVTSLTTVNGRIAAGGVGSTLSSDDDTTLAANSDSLLATQRAVKTYIDSLAIGLSWKNPVVAATTAAGTLASDFENGDVIDGVTLSTGDRILIKDQATGSQNGIYVVAASGAPTRSTDADTGSELVSAAVFVRSGTVNGDKAFVCTNDAIALGSTSIVFVTFLAAVGALLAANNLSDLASISTARTNIGLGTGDSPQFAGINLGHATDTTLTRVSAGVVAVEGKPLVNLTDGGTFSADVVVPDEAYDSAGWNGDLSVPTKNAIRDKIETLSGTLTDLTSADGSVGITNPTTTPDLALNPEWLSANPLINGIIGAAVTGNTLVINVRTKAGTDPSSTDPVNVFFRDSDTDEVFRTITGAVSLTISTGSTLGGSGSIRIWVVLFDDGGTVRLGAINCLSGKNIFPLRTHTVYSSMAEGGGGAADSAHQIYTTTAVTSKVAVVVGYIEVSNPGTWNTAATLLKQMSYGVPLPGQTLQVVGYSDGELATGTTTVVNDDTKPQNGEGDQYLSQSITPHAALNVLKVEASLMLASSANGQVMIGSLFIDSTADSLASDFDVYPSAGAAKARKLIYEHISTGTSAVTFKARGGGNVAGTTSFNGSGGARLLGGALNSYIYVTEIMG